MTNNMQINVVKVTMFIVSYLNKIKELVTYLTEEHRIMQKPAKKSYNAYILYTNIHTHPHTHYSKVTI